MQQTQCTYYNLLWIDLGQFGDLFGTDCETYQVVNTETVSIFSNELSDPVFSQVVIQDRSYLETSWTVNSVDILLGLIGGFIGLIWDLLNRFLGGYESFAFSTALISEIYSTTDSSRMKKGKVPENLQDAQEDLKKGVETQARYEYAYSEYLTWMLLQLLCCFKCCLVNR